MRSTEPGVEGGWIGARRVGHPAAGTVPAPSTSRSVLRTERSARGERGGDAAYGRGGRPAAAAGDAAYGRGGANVSEYSSPGSWPTSRPSTWIFHGSPSDENAQTPAGPSS